MDRTKKRTDTKTAAGRAALIAERDKAIQELMTIPGVGKSIANDLWNIHIRSVADLKHRDPELLYAESNTFAGAIQDRCLLYVFRCAVYFAETPPAQQDKEQLKWWSWKDKK